MGFRVIFELFAKLSKNHRIPWNLITSFNRIDKQNRRKEFFCRLCELSQVIRCQIWLWFFLSNRKCRFVQLFGFCYVWNSGTHISILLRLLDLITYAGIFIVCTFYPATYQVWEWVHEQEKQWWPYHITSRHVVAMFVRECNKLFVCITIQLFVRYVYMENFQTKRTHIYTPTTKAKIQMDMGKRSEMPWAWTDSMKHESYNIRCDNHHNP